MWKYVEGCVCHPYPAREEFSSQPSESAWQASLASGSFAEIVAQQTLVIRKPEAQVQA